MNPIQQLKQSSMAPLPRMKSRDFAKEIMGVMERGMRAIEAIEAIIAETLQEIVRREAEIKQKQTAHEAVMKALNDEIQDLEKKITEVEDFIRDEIEAREKFFGCTFKEFYASWRKVFELIASHKHPGVSSDGRVSFKTDRMWSWR